MTRKVALIHVFHHVDLTIWIVGEYLCSETVGQVRNVVNFHRVKCLNETVTE
jgi:hypothetical protein